MSSTTEEGGVGGFTAALTVANKHKDHLEKVGELEAAADGRKKKSKGKGRDGKGRRRKKKNNKNNGGGGVDSGSGVDEESLKYVAVALANVSSVKHLPAEETAEHLRQMAAGGAVATLNLCARASGRATRKNVMIALRNISRAKGTDLTASLPALVILSSGTTKKDEATALGCAEILSNVSYEPVARA